jgi:hypothetical protein
VAGHDTESAGGEARPRSRGRGGAGGRCRGPARPPQPQAQASSSTRRPAGRRQVPACAAGSKVSGSVETPRMLPVRTRRRLHACTGEARALHAHHCALHTAHHTVQPVWVWASPQHACTAHACMLSRTREVAVGRGGGAPDCCGHGVPHAHAAVVRPCRAVSGFGIRFNRSIVGFGRVLRYRSGGWRLRVVDPDSTPLNPTLCACSCCSTQPPTKGQVLAGWNVGLPAPPWAGELL